MKTLYILRHGKSDWDNNLPDEDRPLSSRGVNNLISLAEYLKQRGIKPEVVFISTALRTRETFLVLKKRKIKFKDIRFTEHLYEKTGAEIAGFLHELTNDLDKVMLIGHNPGLLEIATFLLGRDIFAKFPTSSFLHLEIPTDDWKMINSGDAILRSFWIP